MAQIRPFLPDWIKRGVVRQIKTSQPLFFSRMFVVPKDEDKVRPIIDLSALNKFLIIPSFKMETALKIALTIVGSLWGCKIDLKDAYFHVPLNWFFQVYFAFIMDEKFFVFQYLPFGLAVAPWAFTRIIKPVKSHLHKMSLRISSFLDDFLLLAESPEELNRISSLVLTLLKNLGFSINKEKSIISPSQRVEYLGVVFLFDTRQLSLPQKKVVKIAKSCQEMSLKSHTTRRQLETLLGLLSFAASLVPLGRLYLRPLLIWMNLKTSPESRDLLVVLDRTFRRDLEVWQNLDFLQSPVPMSLPIPSLQLMTDASSQGWGAALLPDSISGSWDLEFQDCSMNMLELWAVFNAVEHFCPTLKGHPVLIMSDNSTAVACIKNQGTQKSVPLLNLTRKLLEFCSDQGIIPIPKHLPGKLNVLADQESRWDPINTEWSLDQSTFNLLWKRYGPFDCDLFATRFNRKLDCFISPFPDALAQGSNAMSFHWNQWDSIYLFPPIALLNEVITLLFSFRGKGILIAPKFPAAPWFTNLLMRSREHASLPSSFSLSQVTSRGRVFHPNPARLSLQAWLL